MMKIFGTTLLYIPLKGDVIVRTMQVALLLCMCATMYSSSVVSTEEQHTHHLVPKYLTSCPTKCLCVINDHYAETIDLICRNRSGDNIQLPPSVTSLVYNNVSTQLLQSSNLVPTSSDGSVMIKIVYKKSSIKSVSPLTFAGVPYLEHLDLSENLISDFPENIFEHLTKLRVLNLTGNKLESLPRDLFKTQQQLTELYLSANYLHSLLTDVYEKHKNLKILDLSFNKITKIEGSINLIPSLVEVLLNNNKIRDIPDKLFENLENLEILNLANNEIHVISDTVFERLIALENLDLQNNEIINLPSESFKGLTQLKVLNISKNPIILLDDNLIQNNVELNTLQASETHISRITGGLLSRLKRLKELNISNNIRLTSIADFKFSSNNHLQYIDISYGNLTTIPRFIMHLEMVEQLKLEGNPWECTCYSGWFTEWLTNHKHTVSTTLVCDGSKIMIDTLKTMDCEAPEAVNETTAEVLELRSNVILTCKFEGNPPPSITWVTPSGYIFHYYPNNSAGDAFYSHSRIHLYNLEPTAESHVKLLDNGSLEIQELMRQDAGIYTCIAINPVGNATSHIVITLDRKTFYHIKIMCIIVGASCVAAVILCTAIGQIIYWICRKCGLIDERGKQLMQLRENLEIYKSQQLENLRENYTQQVHRIKENCAQQVEWIRDSYRAQVKHIRDFKHYGSHQFSSIRDQYYDQMKKVRDYSTTQLGWVRENYVFQRNRMHKFSSHQVLRFRESYKYQQQALNKLLENLPSLYIDNCKGSSCGRSESSVFVDGDADLQVIDIYAKTKVEEMTQPSVLDEAVDEQSVYYTPSELSDSPMSPVKELCFMKHKEDFLLSPCTYGPNNGREDIPSTSYSAIPWLQDSPCHVFHCSQTEIQCPVNHDFQVPRTLQTSTSLPEMPQVCEERNGILRPTPGPSSSHETAL